MPQNANIGSKTHKLKPAKSALRDKEHLYEEAIKFKVLANSCKEENIRLKTKVKILENEVMKKEKAIEDFWNQNQIFYH